MRTSPFSFRVAGSVVQRCETTPGAVCGARVNARRLVRTPERRCAACGLRRVRAAALQVCVGEAKGADASSLPLGEEKRCQGRRLQSCQKKIDTRFSARTYELAQNGSGQRYGAPLFGKGRSLVGLGCMEAERRPTTDHHTRGPLHRLGRWARSEALRCAGPHGHTTWLGGWAAWFDGGGVPWVPSRRALAHRPVADGGRSGASTAAAFLVRRRGLRLRTMRASVCATAELLVARQHAGGVLTSLIRGREGAGSRLRRMERQRALVVLGFAWHAVARRVGVRSGAKAAGCTSHPPRATRGWSGGCYVHAEGSRATSQGCGEVADMRGSHNDATMASQSPNSTF